MMFVAFYAYKGGVGRTLALANVACLLAEDKEHPQKVLLWDFDLEAPGLHKLFPPSKPRRWGFVDLAYDYGQTGKVGDVKDCIYASDVDGVEVLPAGNVGEEYCERLQLVDWPGLFTEDPSDPGPFFGPLLESIRALEYDYVLIDSRTGLNDQAGICTEVLPDLVVALFRLTDQNLDGLAHVIPAIRSELKRRGRDEVTILPLASPVPSSSSKGIRKNHKRAQGVFAATDLNYIRFDLDLVAEEKLFCRESVGVQSWPVPFIVDDYRKLSETIRKSNPKDTWTAIRRLDVEMIEEDSASARAALWP
ncbi:MAG: tyrosine-protein kinase family protein, partial [Planctomycetota bacterium]